MKIAIFENEYESVRGAFETANLINFNNRLIFKVFTSSQNADFKEIHEYAAIFIDIDLSIKSELDGFGVIQKIRETNEDLINRVIILTANNKIVETMKERNVFDKRIKIVIKPTDYEEVTDKIESVQQS